ncbi:hypothetical protein [Spirillospora sp. NPDC047279]|uniref:hypothetical protein n=1 Tax=Spirillospora sp. NPDC047279 TaxID=3155478 RepID=UPI0033EEE92E
MTGTARRRRHGLAGLLVALFVVAGLVFTYGLGHAPPVRVCTAHLTSVTADAADATARQESAAAHAAGTAGLAAGAASQSLAAGAAGAASQSLAAAPLAATAPLHLPPLDPAAGCLCMALLTLLILALAALPVRTGGRLPARIGWALGPPAPRPPSSPSLSSLQVLLL